MHLNIFPFFKEMGTLAIRKQCHCSAILTGGKALWCIPLHYLSTKLQEKTI